MAVMLLLLQFNFRSQIRSEIPTYCPANLSFMLVLASSVMIIHRLRWIGTSKRDDVDRAGGMMNRPTGAEEFVPDSVGLAKRTSASHIEPIRTSSCEEVAPYPQLIRLVSFMLTNPHASYR
jgi:hypothetical protein